MCCDDVLAMVMEEGVSDPSELLDGALDTSVVVEDSCLAKVVTERVLKAGSLV